MNEKYAIAIAVAGLLAAWFFRNEAHVVAAADRPGFVVVINRWTGSATLIHAGGVRPLKTIEQQ